MRIFATERLFYNTNYTLSLKLHILPSAMKRIFAFLTLALAWTTAVKAATPILGQPEASVDRIYQFIKSKNPGSSFTREIAEEFYNQGSRWGIRGDIAICQSCVETGWFRYSGGTAVTPDDHNYCGLGVTQLGQKGCQFSTIAEGVSAQLQHLWAYATTASLPSGWTLVDPRFGYVNRGCAPNWEDLGSGKWAAASGYGSSIISIYNEMMSFSVANPSLESDVSSVSFTAEQNSAEQSRQITITGQNLSSPIVYNPSLSMFKVSTVNWDNYAGGTMVITLDTSKAPGTYSGYIAVQSGSGDSTQRIEIQCSATITSPTYEPEIKASPTSLILNCIEGGANPTATVSITASNLDEDISYTCTSSIFSVTPTNGWNARSGGDLNISLDASQTPGTYTGVLEISGGVASAKVELTGNISESGASGKIPEFDEIWNHSETGGNPAWGASIRNMDYADGKLYCVYNNSQIKIVDAHTGEETGTLQNGDVVTGGTLTLCDVKCHNGRIYACNLTTNSSDPLRIYQWESDDSNPTLLLSTTEFNGVSRIGDCIDVYGQDDDLLVSFCNDDNTTTRIIQYSRKNGSWSSSVTTATDNGSRLPSGVSTRVKRTDSGWFIDGKGILPTFANTEGAKQYSLIGEPCSHGNDFSTFQYDGKDYMLVSTYLNKAAATYSDGIMRLYDISSGWDKAVGIADYPINGLGTTRNTNTTGSLRTNVVDGAIEAWILVTNQGIAYYRSGNLPDSPPQDYPLPKSFTTDWCYSAKSGNSISYMNPSDDFTRNMVLKGDNLYVLQRGANDAQIHIVNAYSGVPTGTLPATGIAESNWKFSSVANLGDKIIACNLAFSATSPLRVYMWDNDNATPTLMLETTTHGGRSGDLMSASGTPDNGKLYFTSDTGNEGMVYIYTVKNGMASSTPEVITLKKSDGSTYDLGGGFAVIEIREQNDGTIMATGKNGATATFNSDGTFIGEIGNSAVDGNTYGTSYCPFKYGKYNLAAAITYHSGVQEGYLNLVNVTNGEDSPTVLHSYPNLGISGVSNGTFVTTAIAKTEDSKIHLWALIPKQGIAKYTASEGTTTAAPGAISDKTISSVIEYDGTTVSVIGANASELYLTDMSGRIVARSNGNKIKADCIQKGIYVARAVLPDGAAITKKIAIR